MVSKEQENIYAYEAAKLAAFMVTAHSFRQKSQSVALLSHSVVTCIFIQCMDKRITEVDGEEPL
jgi:hypothetical protein